MTNLSKCDKCGNRNIMCFACNDNKHYREWEFSYDKTIRYDAIKEFADWCYINGIDFSYMRKATDTESYSERVIKRFLEEHLKGGK